MKRLAILRHAKSSWDQPGVDDFDRPLSERGIKTARRMGKELERRKLRFDLVLASPAVRVRETLDGVAKADQDFASDVRFEESIYLATAGTLLKLVRGIDEGAEAPLIVGHNPGLEWLIVELTHDDRDGLRTKVAGKYPTAALAVLELPAQSWAEIEPGSGTVVELILPRELD